MADEPKKDEAAPKPPEAAKAGEPAKPAEAAKPAGPPKPAAPAAAGDKPAAPAKPAAPPKEKASQAVPAEPGLPVLPNKPGMTPEAEAAVAAAAIAAGKPIAPGSPQSGTTGVAGEPKPGYARMTPMAPGPVPTTAKPAAAAKKEDVDPRQRQLEMSRRKFLGLVSWSALGWGAFTGASAAGGAVTARFMFPNVLYEPDAKVKVGFPTDYPPDYVEEKYKDTNGIWVVHKDDKIFALITVCTHLGCTPNWLPNEAKFKCPCHGSGFRPTGVNFEGPAPRPLERAAIRVLDDGQILVDKSKKFQQEKGQWDDPDSFITV